MQWNRIYCEDCLSGLKKLDDETADIIIADPPYNIGKNFGNNTDNMHMSEYVAWSKLWLEECLRVLKPTGTLYVYGFSEILAHLSVLLDLDKQRWLVWHYTNKNVPSFRFWQRSHESIIVAWKDRPFFNRDDVREPYSENFLKNAAGKVRAKTTGRFSTGVQETVYQAHPKGALPRDVLNVSTLAGGAAFSQQAIYCKTCQKIICPKEKTLHRHHQLIIHPTQKPAALTDRLLKAARPQNTVFSVVVPFAGSGSECASVLKNGGRFLGFELNPDYATLAQAFADNAR